MSTVSTQRTGAATDDDEKETLSQSAAFRMLSCSRRRQVVHYLSQQQRAVQLYDLSKQLAAWENDIPIEEVEYGQRMCTYTALRQSHLPKLDDEGVIEFDPDSGIVELTEAASQLDVYLDVVPHDELPWSTYYLGVGLISAVFLTCKALGLTPFNLLPGIGYAAIVTILLGLSAVAHRHHEHGTRLGTDGEPPG